MIARRPFLAALLAATTAACTVGPNYQRPAGLPASQVPAPAYKEAAGWTPAQPTLAALDKGSWWAAFNDPVLSELESRVEATNQNIAQFAANYRQARAVVSETRSEFFPTLTSSLSFQRTGSLGSGGQTVVTSGGGGVVSTGGITGTTTGGTGAGGGGTSPGGVTTVNSTGGGAFNRFNGSLDASWAPDLWGRIRRTVEQARAQAQASAADLANATLSAQAELAVDYFQLRSLDLQGKVLRETVAAYQRSLRVIDNQYNAGTVARSDLIAAQTQVLNAQASLVDLGRQRAAFEHAIAVLTGEAPSSLTLAPGAYPLGVPVAPAGVPSTLLQRRPDIASTERAVAAANANIGIQVSAYYPDLTLTGSLGSSADDFFRLFDVQNSIWSLGSSAAETLIDFGARRARVREARAAYDASVAAYRQTVLTAFQGVEDQLAALRVLEQEEAVRVQAATSANRAEQIALNQYAAGTTDFTTVITAQAQALTAREAVVNVHGLRLVAAVTLIQDLGGGWTAADLPRV